MPQNFIGLLKQVEIVSAQLSKECGWMYKEIRVRQTKKKQRLPKFHEVDRNFELFLTVKF